MPIRSRHSLALLMLVLALLACAAPFTAMPTALPPTPTTAPSPTPAPATEEPFRIIGYVTDWDVNANTIPYDLLTHINYAFLIPNADGSLKPLENPQAFDAMVEAAHTHGVQVLISVGGWGWDDEFETLGAKDEARAAFVTGLLSFAAEHDLDGIDMDWEYPGPGRESANNYVALMQALADGLRPQGKLLTAAVIASGSTGDDVTDDVFELVDFLNLMAYDGPSLNHSSMAYAEQALSYWRGRGLPPEKMVLGVPFYSRPIETPYRDLLAADPAAADQDEIKLNGATVYYNGRPTLIAKTELAQREASGIMIWALSHDAPGPASLLSAIFDAAHP